MLPWTRRRILLGITGGIAAYKAAELVRRLQDAGASVRVVMTESAQAFITPLTLQALSGQPVHTSLLDPAAEAAMGHIELARWAELILVAPASANFIARLATGQADDLLTTLCLASDAPLAMAPAMNQGMWRHPATQANVELLRQRGVRIHGPDRGSQACGDVGPGRMLEPEALLQETADCLQPPLLAGQRLVLTAGPTREALDPVRYLSNHSSGKMGFALAAAAAEAGAEVTLVAGPVNQPTPRGVERIDVHSAEEMYQAALAHLEGCDLFVATAAVADYRPARAAEQKIKKNSETLTVELVRNPDIVAAVAARQPRPFVVGFAAETEQLEQHARSKLERKGLDLIVANNVAEAGIGFGSDDNAVTAFWPGGQRSYGRRSKQQLARDLLALVNELRGPAAQ